MPIDGMEQLQADIAAMRARVDTSGQGMRPGLLRAGIVALKAASERIDAGGPGWAPNRSGTPLLHKTGALLRSLTVNGPMNVDTVNGATITVGTNLNYAQYLQEGTSAHGRGTPLMGLRQGPRRYRTGGMPARPYLFIDEQVASKVREIFSSFVMQGIS